MAKHEKFATYITALEACGNHTMGCKRCGYGAIVCHRLVECPVLDRLEKQAAAILQQHPPEAQAEVDEILLGLYFS